MASEGTWDEFVDELSSALRLRRYRWHLERIRAQGAPSEKLVYLFLVLSQPQSFTNVRGALALSRKTVNVALKRLVARRHVEVDEGYLYWVVEPEAGR